jgi:pimeloyl-ACP methyl ester carboxylesterase
VRRTNADTVVVFVHGIFGDARSTWTHPTTNTYWPQLIAEDAAFENADVYVHAFSSPYLSSTYTIDELIENMRLVFDNDEVFQSHKQVVFLCHSMGGLVTRGYLRRYQHLASQVPLIYFFATPTSGAHITHLAQLLSRNPQIRGMLPVGAGEYVSVLQRDWRALPVHVRSRCAYEKQDTHGIRIVDETSATTLCDGPVDLIDADHINIVKPKDQTDLPYVAFKQAFKSIRQNPTAVSGQVEAVTTAALLASRPLQVACGQTVEKIETVSPPQPLKSGQRIVDAVVSVQQARNLKEQSAELVHRSDSAVDVRYHLVGLDMDPSGRCVVGGSGLLVAAFVVAEPTPQPALRVRQETNGDNSPAIYGVQGDVSVVHGAERGEAVPLKAAQPTKRTATSRLGFATVPALQGMLIEQITEGTLSPAIASVGGSVTIQESALPASSSGRTKRQ